MNATPEQIADVMSGENSLRQSEAAIDELLTVFLAKAEPVTRKLADEVYERFLYSVQDYLRDNAAWNLSVEIDRCRRVEAENRTLSEEVRAQAERVRVLEAALEAIRDTHIPDQPMADDIDEAEYARKHHLALRLVAKAALISARALRGAP